MKSQNNDTGVTKIYLVTNCYNNPNWVYIGKTMNSREKSHKKTYGDQIEYTYIDEVNSLNRKEWEPLETYWIEQFEQWGFKIMNVNKKGGGGPEFRTEETKSKISKSNSGKFKGRKAPWVTQDRLGKKRTLESNKKTSKSLKNKPQTQEHKTKRAISQYKPILQFDLEGNFIQEWESATSVAKIKNWKQHNISACCLGRQKTSYNYIWKFKKD